MIGDQKQLPPTCVSQRAAEGGLKESIFDYLLRRLAQFALGSV